MEKKYQPQKWENKIYRLWEKSKAFRPRKFKKKSASRQTFTIIMPPPNANAPLHIGHAMFVTLEDIMIRYHRMKGEVCLLLPGADHAGILTQVVFERQLAKIGKGRFDLGRTKFYQECLKFTQKNKKIMYDQQKKLGASCDWKREKFTLDKKISLQVLRTFISLYQNGLAYRADRLINWCPRCMTALSDLELEYKEIRGKFYYIKYQLKTHSDIGQKIFLVVATTRPETILGDTAVAVHPEDTRYNNFIGQKAILPICGREIPIITDRLVNPEFGTGAVKVTPAHDPLDWQMAKKHHLPVLSVIGFDNKMTAKAGKEFAGLTTQEARKKIIYKLDRKNLLIKEKRHIHKVAHCERCKTIIEPLVSKQWFINTSAKFKVQSAKLRKMLGVKKVSLKQLGSLAVKKSLIRIIPKRFKKNYLTWMKNLSDWCISRQIWWGHRMPIWYCGYSGLSELQRMMNPDLVPNIKYQKSKMGCGKVIVSLTKPKSCPKCHKRTTIIQDPDTFDTWFSSGQWAYTALGFDASHPKSKKNDFAYFYPTSVMETGYEILNIWVAKMIMLSLYRTENIPFKAVYLHGLVRDAFGEKMSKSKGNAINPLAVIAANGADALRLSLTVGAGAGNDISLGEEKIKGYRNFTNKVWNIGRFIYLSLKSVRKQIPWYKDKMKGKTQDDEKIIKKLKQLIRLTTKNLDNHRFSLAGEAIYQFLWHELADKYIEAVKLRIRQKDVVALSVLRHVFLNSLKLLHPFMPFVTEAIWQQLPRKHKEPLIVSSWPR